MVRTSSVAARRKAPVRKKRASAVPPKRVAEGFSPLVLIVDDAQVTRDLYAEYLLYSGLRVALAVDGDHGLWKVLMLSPDLVVMDLAMPGIDGWEATRQLKAHPRTKHIPVIALTGHVSEENLRRARDVGADLVLTKPCTPDELLSQIRKLLSRR